MARCNGGRCAWAVGFFTGQTSATMLKQYESASIPIETQSAMSADELAALAAKTCAVVMTANSTAEMARILALSEHGMLPAMTARKSGEREVRARVGHASLRLAIRVKRSGSPLQPVSGRTVVDS